MTLNLSVWESKAQNAVRLFWATRDDARARQMDSGNMDAGECASVTAGKHMDGFIELLVDIIHANGLPNATVFLDRKHLTLPGYFRPTKIWDMLVFHEEALVAAIEFKSQVGPSFGNNFNNRCEEAIGTAHDLWTVYRENGLSKQPPPFVGWLMLVEDTAASRRPINVYSPHFPVLEGFESVSYLQRYEILCRRLVQERLYTATALVASPRDGRQTGEFVDMSPLTSLRAFIAALAAHIAKTSA